MTIRMAYEMVMPYHLHMPSYFLETFTEYPFHKRDQQRLVLKNNRQALANWIAEGIVKDYKQGKKNRGNGCAFVMPAL